MLLPAVSLPRRRDAAEVIGRALVWKAAGVGHRTIAARLERPPGTVRGWRRAAGRRAKVLERCGTLWTIALGEQTARPGPGPSRPPLYRAMNALGSAAIAWRLRFWEPNLCPWQVIGCLTAGGLLHGRPATGRRSRRCRSHAARRVGSLTTLAPSPDFSGAPRRTAGLAPKRSEGEGRDATLTASTPAL